MDNVLILPETKDTENVATSTDESEFEALAKSKEITVRTNSQWSGEDK